MPRRLLLIALLASTLACSPQETVRLTPSPTVAPSTAAPPATPTPVTPPGFGPTGAPPPSRSPSPTPTATTAPGSTPNTACSALSGGSGTPIAAGTLTAIRAAHNPGFDRFVLEFLEPTVPQYRIELASSFSAPSGQAVRVDGNAFFSVRLSGQAHYNTGPNAGQKSYSQADPYHVALPVLREVKLVEDFEGTVIFGLGMERVVCPTVLTLSGPTRIVLDFPTPP